MSDPAPTFAIKQLSSSKAFSCSILRFEHTSPTLGDLRATFSVILPPTPQPPPPLYWLSGLTCTDQNFVTKAGAAMHAAAADVAIICPDTSPRGAGAPGEDDTWDFGTGAGFYLDATTTAYRPHYRMATYVLHELPAVVAAALPRRIDARRRAVCGHSMGGMGALALALRHAAAFVSVSAFAPIANPARVPWGEKCFSRYLGHDRQAWAEYDPTQLMRARGRPLCDAPILIEQGAADEFLQAQLLPHAFVEACEAVGQKVELRVEEGYDHSYYFIQTFIGKHIAFHAQQLRKALEGVEAEGE